MLREAEHSPKKFQRSLFSSFPFLSLFLLLIFLIFPFLSLALPTHSAFRPHLLFRTFSIEHGLSQNAVLSITRDPAGFMWFGTESGLNRYDGYRFTVYLPVEGDPTSLSNSWVNALLTDRRGRIWVGTENGLNEYNPATDEFIRYFHDPSDPGSLSSSRIFCLFEDRDGRLWVGTDAGLNLFDRSSRKFVRFLPDPLNPATSLSHPTVRAIAQDSAGFLWVATAGGLNRFDPKVGLSIQFRHDPRDPSSLPDDYLNCLLIDSTSGREIIWLGTGSSGLVRFDPSTGQFKTYRRDLPNTPSASSDFDSTVLSLTSPPANTITCLLLDPSGNLWVGTYSGGLAQFSPSREIFVSYRHRAVDPFSLPDNQIRSLYLSPDGNLWVGTYRGLAQLNFNRQFFIRFLSDPSDPSTLSNPVVRAFCPHSSGLLFVGTDGGGLNAMNIRLRHAGSSPVRYFRHQPGFPNSLSSDRIFCLL
ncbi:MAG: two-component regulator propeller domain-containing protein, partial [Candidatus Saccharicenans sp.]|nr:two-component regulator propeller domain-containing protein [Candidatus Saccharicenans sp.]